MSEKRKRGRPAGTSINDTRALAKIADLMVADAKTTMNAASWKVLRGGKPGEYEGLSDNAIVARWRSKFSEAEMAAARKRADRRAAPSGGSIATAGFPVSSGITSSNLAAVTMGWHTPSPMDRYLQEQERMRRLMDPDPFGLSKSIMTMVENERRIRDQMRVVDQFNEQRRIMDQMNAAMRPGWPFT